MGWVEQSVEITNGIINFKNITSITIYGWNHNTTRHQWQHFLSQGIQYTMLFEMPIYLSEMLNNYSIQNQDDFVSEINRIEREKGGNNFSSSVTESTFKLCSHTPRPNLYCIVDERIKSSIAREIMLSKNILKALSLLDTVDAPQNIGTVIGNYHNSTLEYVFTNFTNLTVDNIFTIGRFGTHVIPNEFFEEFSNLSIEKLLI